MPTLSPWAPSSESALTKGFCAEVLLGMLQIQLQSQLGLSHHTSSPKSTSSSGCREQQAVVFPGDEEEEPSSRSHGALLVLVTQQHWTPCGTWVVFQCSSMPFFANLKKKIGLSFVFGAEKMHQGARQFLWKREFIASFNLSARTHLSSGASTSSGKGLWLSLNLTSLIGCVSLAMISNLTTSFSQSIAHACKHYFELLMRSSIRKCSSWYLAYS